MTFDLESMKTGLNADMLGEAEVSFDPEDFPNGETHHT